MTSYSQYFDLFPNQSEKSERYKTRTSLSSMIQLQQSSLTLNTKIILKPAQSFYRFILHFYLNNSPITINNHKITTNPTIVKIILRISFRTRHIDILIFPCRPTPIADSCLASVSSVINGMILLIQRILSQTGV